MEPDRPNGPTDQLAESIIESSIESAVDAGAKSTEYGDGLKAITDELERSIDTSLSTIEQQAGDIERLEKLLKLVRESTEKETE